MEGRRPFEEFVREQLDGIARCIAAEYERRLQAASAGCREQATASDAEETGEAAVGSKGPPKAAPLPAVDDAGCGCRGPHELGDQLPEEAVEPSPSLPSSQGPRHGDGSTVAMRFSEESTAYVESASPAGFALARPAAPAKELECHAATDDGGHPLAVPASDPCTSDAAPPVQGSDCRTLSKQQTPSSRSETPQCLELVVPNTPACRSNRSNTNVSEGSRSNASKRSLLGVPSRNPIDGSVADDLLFTVLPLWSQAGPMAVSKIGSVKTIPSNSVTSSTETVEDDRQVLPVIISPNSLTRLVWDMLSICCIIHDAVVAPLEFLEVSQTDLFVCLGWFTRVFWPCDVVASFLTGVQLPDGALELRLKRIAKHYIVRWFLPDVVLVAADWMELVLDGATKASTLIGLLRMLRLVRLLRLQKMVRVATEKAMTEKVALLLSVVNSVGAIVGIAHALASIWLGLGRGAQGGWVAALGLAEDQHFEQYILALHWSLTNFAGTMEVTPETPMERCFAICSLLLGFLVASWFISNITSSMTRLSIIASKNAHQFSVLNKFMMEHGISGGLARRVQLNAKHALALKEDHMQEADVDLLNILSEPLRAEVHLEIYSPLLMCHPLFHRLTSACPRAMQQLCHLGVSRVVLEEGDFAFTRGEVPDRPKMLFVLSGELSYTQDGERVLPVGCNQWAGEQVLWTDWVYHGNLQAAHTCRILTLDAGVFWRHCGPSMLGSFDVSRYADAFVNWQNSNPTERSDIGDEQACLRILAQEYGDRCRRRSSQTSMSSWMAQRRTSIASFSSIQP